MGDRDFRRQQRCRADKRRRRANQCHRHANQRCHADNKRRVSHPLCNVAMRLINMHSHIGIPPNSTPLIDIGEPLSEVGTPLWLWGSLCLQTHMYYSVSNGNDGYNRYEAKYGDELFFIPDRDGIHRCYDKSANLLFVQNGKGYNCYDAKYGNELFFVLDRDGINRCYEKSKSANLLFVRNGKGYDCYDAKHGNNLFFVRKTYTVYDVYESNCTSRFVSVGNNCYNEVRKPSYIKSTTWQNAEQLVVAF